MVLTLIMQQKWFNSAWTFDLIWFDHHISTIFTKISNTMLRIHTKREGNLSKTNSLDCVIYVRGVARIILTHHVDPELLIYWTLTSFICEVAAMWDSWWAISPEKNWETYHFDVYFLTLPEICLIWILMGIIIYQISETSMNKFKKYSVSQIGLPFLCLSDFKKLANSQPSVLNFKSFSQSPD